MKRILLTLLLICTVMLGAIPTQAADSELPTWYQSQLHKFSDYRVMVLKDKPSKEDLAKLASDPDAYRIVVWQVYPEDAKGDEFDKILPWVAAGGTLWFSDCRFGDKLGFVSAPVGGSEMPPQGCKPSFHEFGKEHHHPGADMFGVANPGGGNPVLEGVDYVQGWTVRVEDPSHHGAGDAMYSAVRMTKDIQPLLRVDPTHGSPLEDRCLAAVRPYGEGYIVFKPLIWEEQYTGGRFQYNLLEWSAGFGVPNMTADGPSSRRRKRIGSTTNTVVLAMTGNDSLTFLDKHEVDGHIVTRNFEFVSLDGGAGRQTLAFDAIRTIVFQEDGARDAVVLKDGKKLMGLVSFPEDLSIKDASGKVAKVKKSELLSLTVHNADSQKGK